MFQLNFISRQTNNCLKNVRYYRKLSRHFPIPLFSGNSAQREHKDKWSSQQLFQNARIIQGGSAGTFYLLPLLTRSLEKLYKVIDDEMYDIGAHKVTMPCLASKKLWQSCDRWELMGAELLKLTDRHQNNLCLSPTHEEAITSLVKGVGNVSYRHLPIKLYQIGRKFRDERRPKNGLLRCREFDMKDLYTFDADDCTAQNTYDQVTEAYKRILSSLDLEFYHVNASSGAMGGSVSHEFHLLSPIGEDLLHKCRNCGSVYNEELVGDSDKLFTCVSNNKCDFEKVSGIEIAHSFILGDKYSKALQAHFIDKDKQKTPYVMGCYGIGVTRLLAAAVEVLSTENKIRWPQMLAPYQVSVIPLKGHDEVFSQAERLCQQISHTCPQLARDVWFDDRPQMSVGEKLNEASSVGLPYAVILGKKSLQSPALYEFKDIYSNTVEFYSEEQVLDRIQEINTRLYPGVHQSRHDSHFTQTITTSQSS